MKYLPKIEMPLAQCIGDDAHLEFLRLSSKFSEETEDKRKLDQLTNLGYRPGMFLSLDRLALVWRKLELEPSFHIREGKWFCEICYKGEPHESDIHDTIQEAALDITLMAVEELCNYEKDVINVNGDN